MSIDRWMDKEDMVHIQRNISHKKEQNNAICSNMNEPRDCHTEWSKSDGQIYDIAYMWNLKKMGTNELVYKIEVESQM